MTMHQIQDLRNLFALSNAIKQRPNIFVVTLKPKKLTDGNSSFSGTAILIDIVLQHLRQNAFKNLNLCLNLNGIGGPAVLGLWSGRNRDTANF
eukprot:1372082-Amphidinium_carterae.1